MDEKIIYERIEEEYNKLRGDLDVIKGDIDAFEETEDFKTYNSIEDDVVKQTMYPEQYELYKRKDELIDKIDHFYDELLKKAVQLYNKYKNEIKSFEDKINVNEEYIKKLEEEIAQLNKEYEELISSEAYKANDEAALLRAEDIKGQIDQKNSLIEKMRENIEKYKPFIEEYKEEMKKLDEIYYFEGMDKDEVTEPNSASNEEQDEIHESVTEPNASSKGKNRNVIRGGSIPSTVESSNTKEDEDKKISKEDIDSLVIKAKTKKLKEEDYDKISEVLSDPSKYEEYGITTGLFSNKGKILLLALSKNAGKVYFDDKKIIKQTSDIKFEQGEDKDIILTGSLKSWSGLKKLVDNPDRKISGEKYLSDIISDLESKETSLEEQEQQALEKAKIGLKRFEALRVASKGYSEVMAERQKNNKFMAWFRGSDVKALDSAREAAPAASAEEPKGKTNSDPLGLKGKTYPPREEDLKSNGEVPPKTDKER